MRGHEYLTLPILEVRPVVSSLDQAENIEPFLQSSTQPTLNKRPADDLFETHDMWKYCFIYTLVLLGVCYSELIWIVLLKRQYEINFSELLHSISFCVRL